MKQEIIEKAEELGQKYFPNNHNIWARGNIEAASVTSACIEMCEWVQNRMIEKVYDKLQKLKCGYEHDLDAEPRVYERHIQLCAKISLIERLILDLKEE